MLQDGSGNFQPELKPDSARTRQWGPPAQNRLLQETGLLLSRGEGCSEEVEPKHRHQRGAGRACPEQDLYCTLPVQFWLRWEERRPKGSSAAFQLGTWTLQNHTTTYCTHRIEANRYRRQQCGHEVIYIIVVIVIFCIHWPSTNFQRCYVLLLWTVEPLLYTKTYN